ncbi:tRNA (adenosine(37)-N6)-threonylcarbamoyltransferase complex transferase subunit TsaD [Candidatus Saccharibacteria bacterium]|nr:tRNA (adenosine(37)-N6)-threonylcarbamoyltransferase complex transferase subunit TsaD [Candidatus Saccharibacteria bacterium]
MNILAIESSCDETAAAIISGDPFSPSPKPTLLSNVVVSQIDIFKAYGGVIPEVAARSHLEAILPVIHEATSTASKNSSEFRTRAAHDPWDAIDAIAVTHTPGLLGSLLVGTLTARTLAILHNKPLYAIHHLKSHIYANWLTDKPLPTFPLLALVVSGGHTQIIYMQEHNHFEIIGTTRDDAVGECFDKVAKILGLPYPGGPAITNAANGKITLSDASSTITTTPGNPNKYHLPHPKIDGLDFSFSGLKTAVLRAVQKDCNVPISYPSHELKSLLTPTQIADFSASFEQTAVDILLDKLEQAKISHHTNNIVIAGGVSANQRLRETAKNRFPTENLFFPEPRFSGDNAAMVGAAAFYEIAKKVKPTDPYKLNIMPRSEIS